MSAPKDTRPTPAREAEAGARGGGGKAREPLEHYVSDAPFDPYSVETLTPEQERYYLAGQWKLMWWKLKRHKLAVASRHHPADHVCVDHLQRDARALQHAQPGHQTYLRAAPGRPLRARGPVHRPLHLRLQIQAQPADPEAGICRGPHQGPPRALLLFGPALPVARPDRDGLPHRLPGRRRHHVPPRHRQDGTGCALAHRHRRAHIADHRPDRRRDQLPPRHRDRRHRRLLRRLDRQPGAAHHRDHALLPGACPCGWRWRPHCPSPGVRC